MRIIYICKVPLDKQSASTIHIIEIVENLNKLGHELLLIAPNIGRYKSKMEIPVKYISYKEGRFAEFVYNISLFIALLKWSLLFKPNLYYIREFTYCFSPILTSMILNIPYILEVPGIREDQYEFERKPSGAIKSFLQKIGFNWLVKLKTQQEIATQKFIFRLLLRFAARIIVVHPKAKQFLNQRYNIDIHKIYIVENGVNINLFTPMDTTHAKKKLELDTNYLYLGFIGTLVGYEKIEVMIKSIPYILEKIPNIKLLIIGFGPEEKVYKKIAKELNLEDKVYFIGQVPIHESPLWINSFDIALIFRPTMRGGFSPLKLYAYMACAKPIVGNKIDELNIIEEVGAGRLVNSNNYEEISDVCVNLLRDEKLREEMGKKGREYTCKYCSWENVSKKVVAILEEVIQN